MGFRKSSISSGEYDNDDHRFEHWTATTASTSSPRGVETASPLSSPSSELYVKQAKNLRGFMRELHGSVAKLVNDVLEENEKPRLKPFWYDTGRQGYFDGCLRNGRQHRCTHRYIWMQPVRHGICKNPREYAHTRENVKIHPAVKRALELDAYMKDVKYKRYER